MKFLKRRQKQETNQQINNEEELGTLKAQTIIRLKETRNEHICRSVLFGQQVVE